jgi:signal transduction histidine kinase
MFKSGLLDNVALRTGIHPGQHLLVLINDLLDISKIESGKDELREVAIDVAELVKSAINMTVTRSEEAGVTMISDVIAGLPQLRGDRRKVLQILVNLASNAIKFTEAGGTATITCHLDKSQAFIFQVIDTGIGIAAEDIPKAFAQFCQVDSALNRNFEGTGLGLPLTKSLVEQHDGTLTLESEVGVGSVFTVRFPPSRTFTQNEVAA